MVVLAVLWVLCVVAARRARPRTPPRIGLARNVVTGAKIVDGAPNAWKYATDAAV